MLGLAPRSAASASRKATTNLPDSHGLPFGNWIVCGIARGLTFTMSPALEAGVNEARERGDDDHKADALAKRYMGIIGSFVLEQVGRSALPPGFGEAQMAERMWVSRRPRGVRCTNPSWMR